MNKELLQKSFEDYKLFFFSEENEKHEIYKWKILKQVFERWNWNAEDKIGMFRETFQIKGNNNLWTSVNYYPVVMALRFFDEFPNETIEAFNSLFNENLGLLDRINIFKNYFDTKLLELRERFPNEKLGYHSQELRSISLYLFLQFPEKYYLYKFNIVKTFSEKYGFNTIVKGRNENYISYLETANNIKEFIKQDNALIEKYYKFLEDKNYYQDKSLNLLTQDFMYSDVQHLSSFKTKRYWLYAPGEGAYKWEEFFSEEIIALGWDDIGDLTQYKNKSEIQTKLISTYESDTNRNNDATANFDFANNVNIGDVIIVKKGRHELLGYGEVISDYYFDESREDYKHCRKVEWKLKGNWAVDNTMVMKTFTDITSYQAYKNPKQKYYEELMQIMLNTNSIMKNENIKILQYKKQIILQGPPGTGKTREAKLIAKEILGLAPTDDLKDNEQFKLIQFHPSYTYEDFVRGIVAKPNPDGEGIIYEAENKTLGDFATKALDNFLASKGQLTIDSEFQTRFNTLIDEINSEINSGKIFKFGDKSTAEIISVGNEYLIYSFPERKEIRYKLLFSDIEKVYNKRQEINIPIDLRDKEKELGLQMKGKYPYYFMILKSLEKIELPENFNLQNSVVEEKPYILIIDEINRANLSSVLGELIYALEYRGKAVESMYSVENSILNNKNQLILPDNLYIIGTMNTADRSVGHIDYAIRRRFAFVEVLPKDLSSEMGDGEFYTDLFSAVKALFTKDDYQTKSDYLSQEFEPKDVTLGHSYFIDKTKDGGDIKTRWNYEIKPILLEYIRDGILKESALEQVISIETTFDLKIQ